MASHRKCKRASQMMWSMLRRHARQNIHLENDPLGRRYEVNRHNIRAYHANRGWLISVREKLIDQLRAEGWTLANSEFTLRLRSPKNEVEVTIDDIYALPNREYRFEVGVW